MPHLLQFRMYIPYHVLVGDIRQDSQLVPDQFPHQVGRGSDLRPDRLPGVVDCRYNAYGRRQQQYGGDDQQQAGFQG